MCSNKEQLVEAPCGMNIFLVCTLCKIAMCTITWPSSCVFSLWMAPYLISKYDVHLPWEGISQSGIAQYGTVGYRLGSSTKEQSRAIVCIPAIAPCSVCVTAVRKTDLHVTQSETAIRLEDTRVVEKV
jgi:hypothetical protein